MTDDAKGFGEIYETECYYCKHKCKRFTRETQGGEDRFVCGACYQDAEFSPLMGYWFVYINDYPEGKDPGPKPKHFYKRHMEEQGMYWR